MSGFIFIFLTGFTLFSVLLIFPLLITLFIFMHGFCNIHHKDWLTYSGKNDRLVKWPYSEGQLSDTDP